MSYIFDGFVYSHFYRERLGSHISFIFCFVAGVLNNGNVHMEYYQSMMNEMEGESLSSFGLIFNFFYGGGPNSFGACPGDCNYAVGIEYY